MWVFVLMFSAAYKMTSLRTVMWGSAIMYRGNYNWNYTSSILLFIVLITDYTLIHTESLRPILILIFGRWIMKYWIIHFLLILKYNIKAFLVVVFDMKINTEQATLDLKNQLVGALCWTHSVTVRLFLNDLKPTLTFLSCFFLLLISQHLHWYQYIYNKLK